MLICGYCLSASADVWKYVDEQGTTHFVDSNATIYTWLDDVGKRHYADMPAHATAVSVELVWHSKGDIAELQLGGGSAQESGSNDAYPGETPEERFEREQAEAYYCKRAQEIHALYLKSPRMFKTGEDGTRDYLSDEEVATILSETAAQADELCN